jgi:hypothetical protein
MDGIFLAWFHRRPKSQEGVMRKRYRVTLTESERHDLRKLVSAGVGVGIADGGDLLAGDAVGDQLLDDLLVRRVTPFGRIDAQVGEDHLRAACRGSAIPGGGDVFN